MLRVMILSPYKGDVGRNLVYARRAMKDSVARLEAPFAAHLLYPFILNDSVASERTKGFELEEAWLKVADLVAVYHDLGISHGMQLIINAAMIFSLRIEYRLLDDKTK